MDSTYLVMLETSANQAYLFSTNRLRENVGASQLTYQAGTDFIQEAITEVTGKTHYSTQSWRSRVSTLNDKPPLEHGESIELIQLTSGKALLLTGDLELARKLVASATRQALLKAPGMDLCGVISDGFRWDEEPISEKVRAVHEEFERVRGDRRQPAARFPRLPVVADCDSSGRPAYTVLCPEQNREELLSRSSLCKREAASAGYERIEKLVKPFYSITSSLDKLERDFKNLDWIAVVHADGNGLGQIFRDFEHYAGLPANEAMPTCNRAYVNRLRSFSVALEEATGNAFIHALKDLEKAMDVEDTTRHYRRSRRSLPIFPLVLGGDDLTAICDGRYALAFACSYLRAFERQTADSNLQNGIIPQIAGRAFTNCRRLATCAGIAIVKPHFPFHSAYDLAESLLCSAKAVKRYVKQNATPYPCSALDFHVLYDASFRDLDDIRRKLMLEDQTTRLFARPYVVTPADDVPAAAGGAWMDDHHIENLACRVRTLHRSDEDGRRILPNSQLHALREALFLGRDGANERLRLILERYRDRGLKTLLEADDSLFRLIPEDELEEKPGSKPVWETRFRDALEIAGFWTGDLTPN